MEKITKALCLMMTTLFVIPTVLATTSEVSQTQDNAWIMNHPPNKPTIEGPTRGIINTPHTYFVCAEDPDGDKIRYNFDWGDGCEYWSACCYCSGEICEVCHCWDCSGAFKIRVRAMDEHLAYGEWSDPLRVTMPSTYHTSIELVIEWLLQLFKITIP